MPTLTRDNTPPTTCSPPHQSRQTGNPSNLRPATVSEEEHGGRDQTSRRTSMRAAPECRQSPTAWHAAQPRSSSTSHTPQQQEAVHRELHPGTGKGARTQDRCSSPHGRPRAPPGPRPRRRPPRPRSPTRHVPCQQKQAGGNEDILSSATGPSTN